MTDSWNQDDDNFWNQEGVYEDVIGDRQDQAESDQETWMEEAGREHSEFLAEVEKEKGTDHFSIGYGERLSWDPSLRGKCFSLNDYILLLSTSGIYEDNECGASIIDDLFLEEAILNVYYKRIFNSSLSDLTKKQRDAYVVDSGYLLCGGDFEKYFEKMLKLLKSGGIDAIIEWLPSVVNYINRQKGSD